MDLYTQIQLKRRDETTPASVGVDDAKEPNDFLADITLSASTFHNNPPYTTEDVDGFRKDLMDIITTAVAAVESLDRQRAATGKTSYEE